jgi:hypothetical protein
LTAEELAESFHLALRAHSWRRSFNIGRLQIGIVWRYKQKEKA